MCINGRPYCNRCGLQLQSGDIGARARGEICECKIPLIKNPQQPMSHPLNELQPKLLVKPNKKDKKSAEINCHHAKMRTVPKELRRGQTYHYECTWCGNACDIASQEGDWEERFSVHDFYGPSFEESLAKCEKYKKLLSQEIQHAVEEERNSWLNQEASQSHSWIYATDHYYCNKCGETARIPRSGYCPFDSTK